MIGTDWIGSKSYDHRHDSPHKKRNNGSTSFNRIHNKTKNTKYHTVRTVLKSNRKNKNYHTVGTVPKSNRKNKNYHTVGTVPKSNRKTKTTILTEQF